MKFTGSKDIKDQVKAFLRENRERLSGRLVIDVPAGTGISTRELLDLGANVEAYDLFPEFFKVKGAECTKADIAKGLPVPDAHADFVLCQEGIEHLADQAQAFREFSRILKKGGSLILTTPNYSGIRARLSYLLGESEHYKFMPPNELESIWVSGDKEGEIYFGHIFLTGIQKLRVLARIAGFRIRQIVSPRVNFTSLLFYIVLAPFIWLNRRLAYNRAMRKNKHIDRELREEVFREQLKLSLSADVLLGRHLFVEFEKVEAPAEAARKLQSRIKSFDEIT